MGIASYTFELGTEFFEDCTYFENTILPDNMPALLYAIKVARTPYMTPAGPDGLNLALDSGSTPPGVPSGTIVTLTATIDDTRYNNSNGTEGSQNITAAEYYLDVPPWIRDPVPVAIPMSPSDGSFDSTIEAIEAYIDTTGLSEGQHIIFVRGQDADNNWGAFSAIFLFIESQSCYDASDCDDGLFCNGAETCVSGICQSGTPPDCDDGVSCTEDSCNEGTNSCDHIANDSLCDNGLFCDGTETCDTLLGCQAGSDPCPGQPCDEGTDSCIECGNGICDESYGEHCSNCPQDCPGDGFKGECCGNGICEKFEGKKRTCPEDCG
jgi:hypothetical protein